MAITWRPARKQQCVKDVLAAHPANKNRCLDAAGYIHPLAHHQDSGARFWLLRPHPECGPALMIEEGSIRILPSIPHPPRWVYHVCVETQEHCVCALTGPGGEPKGSYLSEHFQDADAILPHAIARYEDLEVRVSAIGRRRA